MIGLILYPPSIVPNNSTAFTLLIRGQTLLPLAISARNSAFTAAASSTPAGTRLVIRSSKKSSSPAGGFFNNSIRSVTCRELRGSGGTPSVLRSSTCLRYSSSIKCSSWLLCYILFLPVIATSGGIFLFSCYAQKHHNKKRRLMQLHDASSLISKDNISTFRFDISILNYRYFFEP